MQEATCIIKLLHGINHLVKHQVEICAEEYASYTGFSQVGDVREASDPQVSQGNRARSGDYCG